MFRVTCQVGYQFPSDGQWAKAVVELTTTPVAGSVSLTTPSTVVLGAGQQSAGATVQGSVTVMDQLELPLANRALDVVCGDAAQNGLRFAASGPVTTNASGIAAFTLVASEGAASGAGVVAPIQCTVGTDGVTAQVTLDGVRIQQITATPATRRLSLVEQEAGTAIPVVFDLVDNQSAAASGVSVTLTCNAPAANGLALTVNQPGTRTTDAAGRAAFTLQTVVTDAGKPRLPEPITCSINAGGVTGSIVVDGESPTIFRSGFEG